MKRDSFKLIHDRRGVATAVAIGTAVAGVGASMYGANKQAKAQGSAADKQAAAVAEANRLAHERWLASRGVGARGKAVNTKLPLWATWRPKTK